MIRPLAIGLILALGFSAPVFASVTKDDLPKSIVRAIGKDAEGTIQQFAETMLEVHPEGIITQEVLEKYRQYLLARKRSEKLQIILAFDLDFDGILSKDELDYARTIPNKRGWLRRPQLELMILDADLDTDGTLDFDEIRRHVIRSVDTDINSRLGRRTAFVFDILVLDLDGDGTLTIPEMAKAVRELSAN